MNISDALRKAFDPKTQFKRNPTIDSRYSDERATVIELVVKHRATGHYNCYIEAGFDDDGILQARLISAESLQRPDDWATRSVYIALQSQIDKMNDAVHLAVTQK